MSDIVLPKKRKSSCMVITSGRNHPIGYIQNDMFSIPIYNINSITWSQYLKSFHDDVPDELIYYISNQFELNSVTLYFNIIDLISDDKIHLINLYLENINITSNFLEFINYIGSDIIITYVVKYINLNFSNLNKNIFNMLNYDIKFSIYMYCDLDNIPQLFKDEAYFYSQWNKKFINGPIIFEMTYHASFTFVFKTYNTDINGTVIIYKKTNNIEFQYTNFYNTKYIHTYYDNYFLWNIIRDHLEDSSFIKKYDDIYTKKPKFINYKKDNFNNYDNIRGCFLQTTDNDLLVLNIFREIIISI